MIKAEEQVIYAVVHLLQSHVILIQGMAHEKLIVEYSDRSCSTDSPHQIIARVFVGLDPCRHPPAGRLIDFRRSFHLDCFVRTHVIELFPEIIKFALLCPHAAGRGYGGFLLPYRVLRDERAVHALVDAVLLRFSRLDELRVDAEFDEPYR